MKFQITSLEGEKSIFSLDEIVPNDEGTFYVDSVPYDLYSAKVIAELGIIAHPEPSEWDNGCPECYSDDNIECGSQSIIGNKSYDDFTCMNCGCQFTVHSHIVFNRIEVTKQGKPQ